MNDTANGKQENYAIKSRLFLNDAFKIIVTFFFALLSFIGMEIVYQYKDMKKVLTEIIQENTKRDIKNVRQDERLNVNDQTHLEIYRRLNRIEDKLDKL